VRRFWLSDTMSLQLDDGRLKCLRHPDESGDCEGCGLTLAQASQRGRLYRESFYVCRNCGKCGETIRKQIRRDSEPSTFSVRGAMKWGWGSAAIVVPLFAWRGWWQGVAVVGGALVASPGIYCWENRKIARALAARGLPRADAPGQIAVAEPTVGCLDEAIIGRMFTDDAGQARATGPCCDTPDWIEAFRVTDEDRVPCCACGKGVMIVSEQAIH